MRQNVGECYNPFFAKGAIPSNMRRGARVVESGGLENRCTRKGTVGSNPTLSARIEGKSKKVKVKNKAGE